MPHAQTILVTGSGGFIGRAISRARLTDGYDVIGLDRPGGGQPEPDVTTVLCDLTSDESVASAVRQVSTECEDRLASTVHLAAYYDFSGEPSPLYEEVTIRGTERLLRHLRATQLEQFRAARGA